MAWRALGGVVRPLPGPGASATRGPAGTRRGGPVRCRSGGRPRTPGTSDQGRDVLGAPVDSMNQARTNRRGGGLGVEVGLEVRRAAEAGVACARWPARRRCRSVRSRRRGRLRSALYGRRRLPAGGPGSGPTVRSAAVRCVAPGARGGGHRRHRRDRSALGSGADAADAAVERVQDAEIAQPGQGAPGDAAAGIGGDGIEVQGFDVADGQELMVVDGAQDGTVAIRETIIDDVDGSG